MCAEQLGWAYFYTLNGSIYDYSFRKSLLSYKLPATITLDVVYSLSNFSLIVALKPLLVCSASLASIGPLSWRSVRLGLVFGVLTQAQSVLLSLIHWPSALSFVYSLKLRRLSCVFLVDNVYSSDRLHLTLILIYTWLEFVSCYCSLSVCFTLLIMVLCTLWGLINDVQVIHSMTCPSVKVEFVKPSKTLYNAHFKDSI